MPQYISKFPKAFLEDLKKGRCIPFIGAGFSLNADVPPGHKMPDWDQLGKEIASLLTNYDDYRSPIDAISTYCYEYQRTKLVEQLTSSLLIDKAEPAGAHRAFCKLPFQLVCTTNLDFLLERAYDAIHRYCHPIVGEDQLAVNTDGNSVSLIKLHGDVHHPNQLVVTEQDYDGFIDRNRLLATFIANLLIAKTALFIGYSLDDPDFRQIWQLIGDRLGDLRRMAYTIAVSPSAGYITRFERRGVKVITLPGKPSDYPTILEHVFDELREYWLSGVLTISTVTDDDPAAELALPQDADSRLCLFLVPFELLSFYRGMVFPIAQQSGFIPVSAEDVCAPGDNIQATIAALVERAKLVVVDTASHGTQFDMGVISTRKRHRRSLLIRDNITELPSDISTLDVITRDKDIYNQSNNFLDQLDIWFNKASEGLDVMLEREPRRLLDKGENRAAVISAITLLEKHIRSILEKEEYCIKSVYSLTRLLKYAAERGILNKQQYLTTLDWVAIRNRIVHSHVSITGNIAKIIVAGIYDIVESNNK